MTSPTQRRHDELRDLLTEIRDRLPEPPRVEVNAPDFSHVNESIRRAFAKVGSFTTEPVDVTECRDCGRSDGGCDRVDTAPDVDPVEARVCYSDECGDPCQSKQARDRDEIARLVEQVDITSKRLGRERKAREHIEADVERLTRDRDKWFKVAKEAGSRANSEATHRAAADARYEALRADIADRRDTTFYTGASRTAVQSTLVGILRRDDERGRDA